MEDFKHAPLADLVLAATTEDGTLSLVAAITTELTRETQRRHQLAPTAAIALGRLITGATLFGASLKGQDRISLQVVGDGPLNTLAADVFLNNPEEIGARAHARYPEVDLTSEAAGTIGAAVGQGRMQVTKSYEIGQPYVGIVALHNGEIGPDLAWYLRHSQQIPSIAALDVVNTDQGIQTAGGYIVQVMPNADESVFSKLETHAAQLPALADLLSGGATPRELIDRLTAGRTLRSIQAYTVRFTCRCSRDKVATALLGLGRDELTKMAQDKEPTEAICDFCRQAYYFQPDEISDLAKRLFRHG